MAAQKGFSIVEILVVLIIISVSLAVFIPSVTNAQFNSRIRAVQNNMRAIGAADQRYFEDNNNVYYTSATGNDFILINQNLRLSLTDMGNGFQYSCANTGTCTAISATFPSAPGTTISIDATGNLTCASVLPCPN